MAIYHHLLKKSVTATGYLNSYRNFLGSHARQVFYILVTFTVDKRNVLYCREINAVLQHNGSLY
jgi:hypothetical protein